MKNFVSTEKRAPKEVSKSSYSNLFQKTLVKEMVTEPFFTKFVGLRFFKKVVCYGSFLEIFCGRFENRYLSENMLVTVFERCQIAMKCTYLIW